MDGGLGLKRGSKRFENRISNLPFILAADTSWSNNPYEFVFSSNFTLFNFSEIEDNLIKYLRRPIVFSSLKTFDKRDFSNPSASSLMDDAFSN